MVECPFCGFQDVNDRLFSILEISKDGGPPHETVLCDQCAVRIAKALVSGGATVAPDASVN